MAKEKMTSEKEEKLEEKLLKITRVSKTVKGGRKMSFSVLAAVIRAKRPPEPYKGKGIKYAGEVIRRKEGKKA